MALGGNANIMFDAYCFIGQEAGCQLAGAARPQGFSVDGRWMMGRPTFNFLRTFGTFWDMLDTFWDLGGLGYILLFLVFHAYMKFISNWATYDDSGLH